MRKIKLTKGFAGLKKGKELILDSMLASHIVRIDKAAKYADKPGQADAILKEERKAEIMAKLEAEHIAALEEKYIAETKEELAKEDPDKFKSALLEKLQNELHKRG